MKKTYIVIVSAILILFCLMYSVSYAYFSIKVNNDFNNGTSGNTTIGSDTVKDIIISDGTKVTSSNIIPGESVTSTFTVQNPNEVSLCFGLDWINVVNEFVNKSDIVVSLKDENGTVLLEDKEFPTENNTTLIEGLTIPANTTKTYTLTVTYKDTDKDQSVDMNKKFQATLTGKLTTCIYTAIETVEKLAEGANLNSSDIYTVPDKTSDSCTYTLAYDRTSDNNLRYVGANPCNYVTFNGEEAGWRIIGILKTPEGQRIKMIRTESIGKLSWNHSLTGYSLNDWAKSSLQMLLNNGAYYNRTTGQYYNSTTVTTLDFTNNGLTQNSKDLIEQITWNLGNDYGTGSRYLSNHLFYMKERGMIYPTTRKSSWQGKVGLIYASDYIYASSTIPRSVCTSATGGQGCYDNNWLASQKWFLNISLNQQDDSDYRNRGALIPNSTYWFSEVMVTSEVAVYPTIYLKSYTQIKSGEGTPENPYVIG